LRWLLLAQVQSDLVEHGLPLQWVLLDLLQGLELFVSFLHELSVILQAAGGLRELELLQGHRGGLLRRVEFARAHQVTPCRLLLRACYYGCGS
jgi:hypothetical protein